MAAFRRFSLACSAALRAPAVHTEPSSFTYDGSDLKLCASGDPKTVKSPTFVVKGLP